MTKYREIIRLTGLGFSQRNIMASCGVAQKTVVKVQKRARELNLSWPLDESMTDTELQRLMFAKTTRNIWNGMVTVFANGLSGEIRPVNRIEQRISEAEKLGFSRMLIPKQNMQGLDRKKIKIRLAPVRKVEEAFRELFG